MKLFYSIVTCLLCVILSAQIDSIESKLQFTDNLEMVEIQQKMVIYNPSDQKINTLGLHAWMNAYSRRLSSLSVRMLEDRNSDLYFSDPKDRGSMVNLESSKNYQQHDDEFISIALEKPLLPHDSIVLYCHYSMIIPSGDFTQYGRQDQSALLKYFLLQPVKNYEKGEPQFVHYIDLETLPLKPTYYSLWVENTFEKLDTNLPKINAHLFKGELVDAVSMVIEPEHLYTYNIHHTEVAINYKIDSIQESYLPVILNRQLAYLQNNYSLHPDKLLITFKTRKLQNFTGIENIEITNKYQIELFTPEEQIDLKMFQMLTYESLRQKLNLNLETEHWILNGLLVYMQINYIHQYYPKLKLAGHLPEDFKVMGMHPLKWFFAADLNLTDRYKLAYLYIVKQNYEQDIDTPFSEFNRINQTIISAFKTGIGFNYMNDYLGNNQLNTILKQFLNQDTQLPISEKSFQSYISDRSAKNVDWFFNQFITSSDKLNFKLKKFKQEGDSLLVNIENTTDFKGPFKLVAYKKDSIVQQLWMESKGIDATYNFPVGDYDKLIINPGYTLAEFNYRDNYIYTTGFYKNGKKLKLRLYADIDNPEYEQIYVTPKVRFNNYDKFILGARFTNVAFMDKQFQYTLSPSFSTGTSSLTGSGDLRYSFLPEKSKFRRINLVSNASYYHYAKDLPYLKVSNYVTFEFNKNPRSHINRTLLASFMNIDKKRNPLDSLQNVESLQYNLFKAAYVVRDDNVIFEKYYQGNIEAASLFSKINMEWFGRYEYRYRHKITFRWFGSIFLFNKAQTDYFNTTLYRISDYSFGYNLLARSDATGVFSQQYVMAEGGFVSRFNDTVDQWVSTFRTEFPVWKMFTVYGGMGLYKNKGFQPKFIYESGVKIVLIPDFFSLYFPIQSSLGFEPMNYHYSRNIRFTFNMNLSALRRYIEKGWY